MSLKNKSEVSTISGPEFINLEPLDVNPLMSKCEIKVFYLGHNRNHSYINRETALEMSKTLRGTPIVASWNENKEDYGDHGHVVHIEDGEISFSCKTVPYGFVSPDAKVWFQNFTDTDEFDNKVERTYLMTTGYLWTGQFEELTKVIQEGQPHSMELDGDSIDGHWATDNNLGVEFFIINDATFSKLCILGDDVEPCYEGSSVTSPQISSNFSKETFEHTLFTMMQELKDTLNSKGGLNMAKEETEFVESNENAEVTQEQEVEETTAEVDFNAESEDNNNDGADEFVKKDEEKSNSDNKDDEKDDSEDDSDDKEDDAENEDDKKKKPANQHSLEEFEALQAEINSLRAENEELRNFKLNIEMKEKKDLVNQYFMLSDEDKADIVNNLANYSLDEIKAKLAILYVEKNVDFSKVDGQSKDEASPALSFSLEEDTNQETLTDLQRALRETKI